MKRLLMLIIILSILPQVQSKGGVVPPNIWEFDEDYFTVYGSPEMVVSIAGSTEYDRGNSATILIQVMNQGKIVGFESEDEPDDANEIALSKMEQQMEYSVTTAVGVMASLSAEESPLEIKTPPQSAGTLLSGQVSEPLQFEIKVWDSAAAGTYPLKVDLTYQFQKDVQVDGNATSNEIDYNMLYQEVNESHDILIIVREQADFEATDVDSELLPGSPGILYITFTNTGEQTASRATARLRLSDPLSSTDYTAFMGDMLPGDDVQAGFKIDVDPDATAKTYSIKAEIEYEDSEGKTMISDTIYVPAEVREPEKKAKILENPFLLGAGLLVLTALAYLYMKRREQQ
jgi:hypothetical protein